MASGDQSLQFSFNGSLDLTGETLACLVGEYVCTFQRFSRREQSVAFATTVAAPASPCGSPEIEFGLIPAIRDVLDVVGRPGGKSVGGNDLSSGRRNELVRARHFERCLLRVLLVRDFPVLGLEVLFPFFIHAFPFVLLVPCLPGRGQSTLRVIGGCDGGLEQCFCPKNVPNFHIPS